SDLLVFGRRAGMGAAEYAAGLASAPAVDEAEVDQLTRDALVPFERDGGENPYALQHELQETMHNLVGIIRVRSELEEARQKIGELKERSTKVTVEGHRQYNPGWHLALDLESLLAVSEAVANSALLREESRGGHTRDDFPQADPDKWGKLNNTVRRSGDGIAITQDPVPVMPDELKKLFEEPAK
ncbi:MAG TPA: hypothetical protein VGR90_11455, partial [Acidimicrobiales bacterium]|nr:hypothetical protein [Acidimicrobiales bacterium]